MQGAATAGEQIGIYLGRLVMEGNEAKIAAAVVHGHHRQEDIEGLSQSPNREEERRRKSSSSIARVWFWSSRKN